MRAARLYDRHDLRIDDVDAGTVGPTDVRIDVAACGICGTDIHEYEQPQFTPTDPHPQTGASRPVTLGHEFGGEVSEVGTDVTGINVGDAVTINPNIPCGTCRYCEDGVYNRCEDVVAVGYQTGTGGFAESAVVPAQQVHQLPGGVDPWEGALVEPLAVGLHAVRRSGLQNGDTAAVFGCGPIGLAVVQSLVSAGAKRVFAVEPSDTRREVALALGADVSVDPSEVDAVDTITHATTDGVDVAFEFAALEETFNAAVRSTRRGGTITVGSVSDEEIGTDLNDIVLTERTVRGTYCYRFPPRSARSEFGAVLQALADGQFDVDTYVTNRIELEDIVEAGFDSLRGDTQDVKILVRT